MARPNIGHVEPARRPACLDAAKLSKRLDLPETPAFRRLVRTAKSALDDYHFWAGLGRHERDLLHFIRDLRSGLETAQTTCRRYPEVDVFAPVLDDSPLDERLTGAIQACDSILAQFRTDYLPEWMRDDKEALALNVDFPARDEARRDFFVRLAEAFQRYAAIERRSNWTDVWYTHTLYVFVGAVCEAYTVRKAVRKKTATKKKTTNATGKKREKKDISIRTLSWPSDRSGRERLIPPPLRRPARK